MWPWVAQFQMGSHSLRRSYFGANFRHTASGMYSDLLPNRVKRFDVKYATSGGSFVKYGFTVA